MAETNSLQVERILPCFFKSACVLPSHHTRVVPSRRRLASRIFLLSESMFYTLQYKSICLIQLSSFFAFNSPSYIGKSNFTSNLIKGLEGDVDIGGSFPFPLPSEWPSRRGSFVPLSSLEVEVSSTRPFLNSLYISSTMALMVMKLSIN